MTTYDENGGYPHPDHIRCHEVSVAAFEAAGDPDRFPDAGEPWQPSKLYYNLTFHKSRLEKLHQAMLAAKVESPYAEWLVNWEDKPGDAERLTTSVPCAEFFPVRDAALIAHATQVDPTGRWFACPIELQQETWPYEDFQLARSLVDTALPEDDLFAGIRATVLAREGAGLARRSSAGGIGGLPRAAAARAAVRRDRAADPQHERPAQAAAEAVRRAAGARAATEAPRPGRPPRAASTVPTTSASSTTSRACRTPSRSGSASRPTSGGPARNAV